MSSAEVDTGTDDSVEVFQPEVKKAKKKKQRRPKSTADSESMRVYVSSVLQRLSERISLNTLRPLPVFLGITGHSFCLSAGAFTPPKEEKKTLVESIRTRVALNGAFFLTNYALVAFGVAVVVALLHPGMLLVISVVCTLWWLHDYLINHELKVGSRNLGTVLSITQRSTILSVLTALAVIWKCLFPLVSFVVVSGILILLHAIMRDPQHIQSTQYDDADEMFSDGDEVMVERGDVI